MSPTEAIKAGSAFVEFFMDSTRLARETAALGGEIKSWASESFKDLGATVSNKLTQSTNAVSAAFHNQTTAIENASMAVNSLAAHSISAANATHGMMTNVERAALRVPNLFQAASGAVGFFTGQLGNIARGASIGSAGLFLVSKVGRMLGYEVPPQIDKIRSSLFKVALGANAARLALWTIKLPATLVSGITRGIGSIGRGLMGMTRLGGMGAMMAMPMMGPEAAMDAPRQIGEATQQEQGGGLPKFLRPVLTGLLIGGPIGAAAFGLGAFISNVFHRTGQEGGQAFGLLGNRMRAWGAWMAGMFEQVRSKVSATFERIRGDGEPLLTRLERAFIPLTHAIQNVWLPAMLTSIDRVGNAFVNNNRRMENSWSAWLTSGVSQMSDFVGNLDIYFQVAQQSLVKWISNDIVLFQDFFTNVVRLAKWFGENWSNILMDIANLHVEFTNGMVKNFEEGFSAIIDFASGKGWHFEASNPLAGLESSIKEWPKLVRTELAETTPELEALYEKLAKRFKSTAEAMAQNKLIPDIEVATANAEATRKRSPEPIFAAVSAQSQEGYSLLAKLQNSGGTTPKDPVAENTKKTADELVKLRRATERGFRQKEGGLEPWMIPG